jgi:hypothetical protein
LALSEPCSLGHAASLRYRRTWFWSMHKGLIICLPCDRGTMCTVVSQGQQLRREGRSHGLQLRREVLSSEALIDYSCAADPSCCTQVIALAVSAVSSRYQPRMASLVASRSPRHNASRVGRVARAISEDAYIDIGPVACGLWTTAESLMWLESVQAVGCGVQAKEAHSGLKLRLA